MSTGMPLQIRRWQEEVAREPGSPAFVPLADMYRREGRLDVARRICLRGLERNPQHVDAHFLLGRIYRESGELDRAHDEWDIALSLDPEHQPARRALGFLCFERQDWAGAQRHLADVAAADPNDDQVASALALARRQAWRRAEPQEAVGPSRLRELLTPPLERFVREARVRLSLLIDASGRIMLQHGFSRELDVAAFASLAAGIHSASRAMARMQGQPGFAQLYQGSGERQIFLAPVPTPVGELLLLAVFGTESSIGLVRVLFPIFAEQVAAIPTWPLLPRSGGAELERELASGLRRALGPG